MIIDVKKIDLVEENPSLVSTKMGISIDNESAIMEIVVGFYKNKPESIVREWVSNSIDARTESKKLDKPVIAKLYKKEDGWYFSAQDFGIGINQETVDTILSQFGKSTKTLSNDLLGSYGI